MNYRIVDDLDQMNLSDIIRLLKSTYWADKRSDEQIEKSARNSSCFSAEIVTPFFILPIDPHVPS